jgi:acyl dehydratase
VASATRFGGLIASGTQTTGILLGSVANHLFPGNASLGLECSFKLRKAVPARSAMTVRWTVLTITPKPSLAGVIVTLRGGLYDEAGIAAVEANATILVMPPDALRRAPAATG